MYQAYHRLASVRHSGAFFLPSCAFRTIFTLFVLYFLCSPLELNVTVAVTLLYTTLQTDCVNASTALSIRNSCLLPFLAQHFRASSLVDIEFHGLLYLALFELTRQLTSSPHLKPLFHVLVSGGGDGKAEASTGGSTFVAAVRDLCGRYAQLHKSFGGASGHAGASGVSRQPSTPALSRHNSDSEIQVQLIKSATDLLTVVEARLAELASGSGVVAQVAAAASGSSRASSGSHAEAIYAARLDDLQRFAFVGEFSGHKFGAQAADVSRAVFKRVHQEYQDLSRALPVSRSSSVILRANESKSYLARMLITGPEDTPYAHGCFLFDVMFPNGYPAVPPMVNLQTTGRGSVRFNPNLYNCGKVCLSLLGTWAGPGWEAGTSTFLQLAVSIQALIFVGDPYFNEPGYEASMHTSAGQEKSRTYNENIRLRTMQWAMLDVLKSPPEHFEDVVTAHFQLKAAAIIETTRVWVKEARSMQSEYAKAQSELEQLLTPFLALDLGGQSAASLAADTEEMTAAAAALAVTDWSCDICTFLNGPLALQCAMCSSPAAPVEVSAAAVAAGTGWPCDICTFMNGPLATQCGMCNESLPAMPVAMPASGAAAAAAAAAASTGCQWSCDKCTFMNGPLATECGVCNASPAAMPVAMPAAMPVAMPAAMPAAMPVAMPVAAAGSAAAGSGWSCDNCTFMNGPLVTQCGMCNASAANPSWACATCTVRNHGQVHECEMCGTARSDA